MSSVPLRVVVPLVGDLDQRVTTVVGAVPSVSIQMSPSVGDAGSVGSAVEPEIAPQDEVVPLVVKNLPELPV